MCPQMGVCTCECSCPEARRRCGVAGAPEARGRCETSRGPRGQEVWGSEVPEARRRCEANRGHRGQEKVWTSRGCSYRLL